MALKDHQIPISFEYTKLADYPDDEEIKIFGAGISSGSKYGDQAYFIGEKNEHITLPARYVDFIRNLMLDDDAMAELVSGVVIVKKSYEYDKNKTTPVFDWK